MPYFDLSVRGHVADSVRAHWTGRASHEEDRRQQDTLLEADRAVPYFELSVPGSVRVYQGHNGPHM